MLVILSPAKTLDFDTPGRAHAHSVPDFLAQSKQLIEALRQQSPADLARLMDISSNLADLNYRRYAAWSTPFTPDNAKQAVLAFKGDVYLGLDAASLDKRDLSWAQKHLRILSGLYGVLRPLDLIQPYRLEMGTRLRTATAADLYGFWRGRATAAINEALAATRQRVLVNLASNEYYKALDPARIDARIITPTFKELRNGRYQFVSFSAKRARGLMAGYLIRHRIATFKALKAFDGEGYAFCPERSTDDHWVFLRESRSNAAEPRARRAR